MTIRTMSDTIAPICRIEYAHCDVDVFTVQSVVRLRVRAQICADAWALWIRVCIHCFGAKLLAHRFEWYRIKFNFHVDLPVHLPKFIWFVARENWYVCCNRATALSTYSEPQTSAHRGDFFFVKNFWNSAAVHLIEHRQIDWNPHSFWTFRFDVCMI